MNEPANHEPEPHDSREIRFRDRIVLTGEEACRLWSALPPGWTDPLLEALRRGEAVDGPDAHMLFDIRLRDALDECWSPPTAEPETHPDYELIDRAVIRIQTIEPRVLDDMLGPCEASMGDRQRMLELAGQPILSLGEYARLLRGLPENGDAGVLAAWSLGAEVHPITLHAALNVGARLVADEDAEAVIDLACERLERHFPHEAFPERVDETRRGRSASNELT